MRSARTCYDRLAGRLDVAVVGALLDHDVLVGGDGRYGPGLHLHDAPSDPGHEIDYELTASGHSFLSDIGDRIAQWARGSPALLRRLDRLIHRLGRCHVTFEAQSRCHRAVLVQVLAIPRFVTVGPGQQGA